MRILKGVVFLFVLTLPVVAASDNLDQICIELNHQAADSIRGDGPVISGGPAPLEEALEFARDFRSRSGRGGGCFSYSLMAAGKNWEVLSPGAKRLMTPLLRCCSFESGNDESLEGLSIAFPERAFTDERRARIIKDIEDKIEMLDVYMPAAKKGNLRLSMSMKEDIPDFISPLSNGGEADESYYGIIGTAEDADIVRSVIHQLIHVRQLGYTDGALPWQYEAHALWLMSRIFEEDRCYLNNLRTGGTDTQNPFYSFSCSSGPDPSWFFYLWDLGGKSNDLILPLWEEGRTGTGSMDAMDNVLAASAGMGLDDAFDLYARWNFLRGRYGDPDLNSAGEHWPEIKPAASHDFMPVQGNEQGRAPSVFGVSYIGFDSLDGSESAVRLTFEGSGATDWSVSTMVLTESGGKYFIPLDIDAGRGNLILPVDEIGELFLIVTNLGGEGYSYFDYNLEPEPDYPFTLVDTEVRPSGDKVALSWKTINEQGVTGWNIMRVELRAGKTVMLTPNPVPGPHTSEKAVRYLYLDERQAADSLYVLRAVTDSGLYSERLLGKITGKAHSAGTIRHPSIIRIR